MRSLLSRDCVWLQGHRPEYWRNLRVLLRNEDEIRLVAARARQFRKEFFRRCHKRNLEQYLRPASVPQSIRQRRLDNIRKALSEHLNDIGLADDCIYSRLGYFRCVSAAQNVLAR